MSHIEIYLSDSEFHKKKLSSELDITVEFNIPLSKLY
jgi:hypothetical protein